MLTKDERKKLDETHDSIIRIETVLGNGDDGLVGDVKRIAKSHYNLKRNFIILVSFLAGSGVLTGGIWAFVNHY